MIKKITKFILGTVACFTMCCAGFVVHAMDNNDIDKQIYHAQKILAASEKELSSRDMATFLIYKHNPFSEDGHLAEITLREKYPAEYSKYIQAKTNLDDLLYLQFVIMANQIGKDE